MRFPDFVRDVFIRRMQVKLNEAVEARRVVTGGWEVWAQVETALQANAGGNNSFRFEREKQFPNSNQKCDFVVTPENAQDVQIWVELKVELQAGLGDLLDRFLVDVDKLLIQKRRHVFGNDTGGAISFAVGNAGDYVNTAKFNIPGDQYRYRYIAFNDHGMSPPKNLDDPLPSNQDAIVLYRAVISEH